ncbi:30S ribosomal protein S7 [candidate division WOR_3 bacterium SM23_42]|uniref:Small ribosomal subunit protein uS7 n=1 Tax=candidate division WOR_3 bacterium SM23_42 TaxID=1703779 RepID=A0A0S8FW74_UNCW3|nr:MAG: 30S ribosomal protein S7 [candidate division WOR_3 bacterium SM23_42]
MGRRRRAQIRKVQADPKFSSIIVSKFVNNLMWDGKKSVAQKIFYGALARIEKLTKEDGLAVFEKALNNVKPVLEVRPRRVGGATYQIPMEVRPARKESLAIKWLIRVARARSEYRMEDRLAQEIIAASRNEGGAIKKKEEVHRMAEANRAFAHFRW